MFNELDSVISLKSYVDDLVEFKLLDEVKGERETFPIYALEIGTKDPEAPCFGVFGGVHGLEKIGTEVATSFLATLCEELKWNNELKDLFNKIRLVSIPLVNPAGMAHNSRSNLNGVDIMRNAPIDSKTPSNYFISGHRLSSKLPWYRGKEGEVELETKTLINYVRDHCFESRFSMTIDIHSGFGVRDRLWYPWSKSKKKFPFYEITERVIDAFETTLPHNVYKIEQQSDSYSTHGDVWDYLVVEYEKNHPYGFIPWTLEIGSWTWLKKNPAQLFKSEGIFNPVKKHRFSRTMRRHKLLLNFLLTATLNFKSWE